MDELIEGVSINPLRIIPSENGDVLHGLRSTDPSFAGFGEAYFSTVVQGAIKGWKCHSRMTLNIIVPVGCIRFVIFDDRPGSKTKNNFNEFILGPSSNYARLTVKPGLWMAFQGIESGLNLLLDVANIEHDPAEAKQLPLINDHIPNYSWQ